MCLALEPLEPTDWLTKQSLALDICYYCRFTSTTITTKLENEGCSLQCFSTNTRNKARSERNVRLWEVVREMLHNMSQSSLLY